MPKSPLADDVVTLQINRQLKEKAIEILNTQGLSLSDAVRMLCARIATEKHFPVELEVPNRDTLKALEELESGKGSRHCNVRDFFNKMEKSS
ncbi:MAG: type II toxin-antitoxin system RelB/DinJ family antitoxin [Sutterellaceae bacterium]|nr:type II toxin-antitoxin system RelB/DinJ family antitoxin [Sutterellaceae bacterium]